MAENDEEDCPVCGGDLDDDGICEDCGYDTADDDEE